MATVCAKIFKHHQKADGTYNVKIRVFHKCSVKFIETAHFVSDKQLTKKLTIKDPFVASDINRTLDDYRREIGVLKDRLEFFTAEDLKNHLENKDEEIDFIKFCKEHVAWLKEKSRTGTAANHSTVKNALVDYFKKDSCSIMEINLQFLYSFDRFLRSKRTIVRINQLKREVSTVKDGLTDKGIHNVMRDLRTLFNEAKKRYNNDELGLIKIPHYPFAKYQIPKKPGTKKRNHTVEQIRLIRDCAVKPGSRVWITIHAKYNKVNGIHRWLFGANYRREWATSVRLPLIDITKIHGGLIPEQYGGGMETKSIRLKDSSGTEWVIRSVEKIPTKLVPEKLRGTFAVDWVDDEYSGQHPYSALVVPPLAEAANVPHTNPVIGVLVANTTLGTFGHDFAGRVVLMEEREPGGQSVNTFKLLKDLKEDHNNNIDGEEFLRARMLDLLIGDWDRHADQWRWIGQRSGKGKVYTAVPRDRDQALHVLQGVIPSIAGLPWIDPVLGDFDGKVRSPKYAPVFKSNFLFGFPPTQFPHETYTDIVNKFVHAESDDVLENALRRLPPEDYRLRHDELLLKFKQRRDDIPRVMDSYYRFFNRIVDIRTSDKSELIDISDGPDNGMHIVITKLNPKVKFGDSILNINYLPSVTSEIRLYAMGGNDRVNINTSLTPIKLRIVDSTGFKSFQVRHTSRIVDLYGIADSLNISGDFHRGIKHFYPDTSGARFVPTDLYNVWMPLATGAINKDDGFLLGLGFRYIGHDGFRKLPYSTVQELMVNHSFKSDAFRINYDGQWMSAVGRADITINAIAEAPDNTMNFFGQGNDTRLNRNGDYTRYYRARFDLYTVDPALRWHVSTRTTFSIGPSLEYYSLNPMENVGRSISQPGLITSYDSLTYNRNKLNLGLKANFISDRRDDKVLPSHGFLMTVNASAYSGLSYYSKSLFQLKPEFTYYQIIDSAAIMVFSDRIGGGISFGNPAFYQSMFLGGQGNLLGYLQNRFAGNNMIFNNLQFRLRLANVAGYILPGQLGITGFYDIGRVWTKDDNARIWHQGTGGGIYFAPASLTVLQILAGHSTEGWYPYISMNFRL